MAPSTKKELREILSQTCRGDTWSQLDEVYPGIFIGGEKAAKDVDNLKKIGITHILNAMYNGSETTPEMGIGVSTTAKFYLDKSLDCEFLGIPALDQIGFDMSVYFNQTADFIDSALQTPEGKVMVHCYVGVSRSATLVLSFLIIKKRMTAAEAIKLVRSKRCVIYPNEGFLEQLCQLERHIFSLSER